MTPTVFAALLLHQTANGVPLHLTLHTSREAADAAVMTALRGEWDREHPYRGLAYSLGPSADWRPELLLSEAERQGYTAEVRELPVELSAEQTQP